MATGPTNAGALPSGQNQPVPESPTTHKVIFIDHFGVVNEQWVENGTNAIVPTPRVHDYLTFVEWNQSTENVTEDRVIGATYNTTDGKTYAFITLTAVTGLDLVLYLNKSDGSTLTIDWGDETTSTFTNSGSFNTGTHTYISFGDYEIKIWISTGIGTYSLGNGGLTTKFIGGSNQKINNTLKKMYIGSNVAFLHYHSLRKCMNLEAISLPHGFANLYERALSECYLLKYLVIPVTQTIAGENAVTYCNALKGISLPSSTTRFYDYAFQNNNALKHFVIPKNVTNIGSVSLCYLPLLDKVEIPLGMTSINEAQFMYNIAMKKIIFNTNITYIGVQSFYQCSILESISSLTNVTTIDSLAFFNCYLLDNVIIGNKITNIKAQAFCNCYNLKLLKIYATTPPALASTNVFTGINSICKIYVPDASVTAYKTATNWVTYANYIYPLSDIGE